MVVVAEGLLYQRRFFPLRATLEMVAVDWLGTHRLELT